MTHHDLERLDPEVVLLPSGRAAHEQFERRVGDLEVVALVLEPLERVDDIAQHLAVDIDAELARLELERRAPRHLAHQETGAVADDLGIDVFIRVLAARDGAGVQPRLVGERRRTHVRLLRVDGEVDQLGHVMRDRCKAAEPARRQGLEAHLEREVGDDRYEVAVADTFAVTVDGALHMYCPGAYTGQSVGHPAVRVVVQMHTDRCRQVAHHVGDDALDVERQRPAVGVAQHHAVGAGLRGRLENPQRELGIVAVPVEEVLGVEEHTEPVALQECDRIGDHCDAFIQVGTQRFGHVVVPRLAHDAYRRRTGLDEVA